MPRSLMVVAMMFGSCSTAVMAAGAGSTAAQAASLPGTDPTGTSASQAGFAAAIAAVGSNGGTIIIPCGSYLLDSTIAISTVGINLRGMGFCTQLLVNHGADVFWVKGALTQIHDMEIKIVTARPRRGAAVVHAAANQGLVENLRITSNGKSSNNGFAFLLDSDDADLWHFDHVRIPGGPGPWDAIFRLRLISGTVASTLIDNFHFVNGVVTGAVIDVDGAIDTLLVNNSDFPTFGGKSIRLQNTVGASAGLPRYLHFVNCSVEGGNGGGAAAVAVDVQTATDFQYEGGYVASASTGMILGSGVQFAKILGNHFVSFQRAAIEVAAGARSVIISDNSFMDAGQEKANTYDTISVTGGNQGLKIVNNVFDTGSRLKPRYHINFLPGASDSYIVSGNTHGLKSAETGFIKDSGTGANRTIWANTGVDNQVAGGSTRFNTAVSFAARITGGDGGQVPTSGFTCANPRGCGTTALSNGSATVSVVFGCHPMCSNGSGARAVGCFVSGTTMSVVGSGNDQVFWFCW